MFRDVFDAYKNPPRTLEEGVPVPLWLALVYLGSNAVLNSLNYYWFGRMVNTVRKRFTPPGGGKKKEGKGVKVDGVDGKVKKEL